jgi:hypothetical protein
MIDAKEMEKERVYFCKLKGEKQSLLIQHGQEIEKGRKTVVDTIIDQVNDVVMEVEKNTKQIELLEQTPKKRNCNTPESNKCVW